MPKRAEWRSLPNEPNGGVGLLRVWARDVWALPQVEGSAIAVATLASALAGLTALLYLATLPRILDLAFVTLLASMGLVGLVLFRKLVRRAKGLPSPPRPLPDRFGSLLPLPLPENTFPVHLAIRYRGVLTGIDVAAATFVDGWLHVEGRRTGFALRAGDAEAEWRRGTTLQVTFLDGQSVSLWVASGQKLGSHFRHAATLWIADRDHPEGEPVLPPLAIHPCTRAGRPVAALLGAIFPLVVGGLLAFHASGVAVGEAMLIAILLANLWNARTMLVGRKLDEVDRRAKALTVPTSATPP